MVEVWLGDTHLPWGHKPSITRAIEIIKHMNPGVVGQVGDLYDFYSFSRFPKKPGFITTEDELTQGREMAEEMWRLIHRAAPNARLYQIRGNHCIRPVKICKEKAPELLGLIEPTVRRLFEFENVTTIHDPTQELILGGNVYIHGYRSKLGDHCKHNMRNTVCGHSHRGGTFFMPTIDGRQIWEANCGHLADPQSEPLQYNPQRYVHWTRGIVVIDNCGPRFIPL